MRPEDVNRVFQNNAESLTEWITKGAVMHCIKAKKWGKCCLFANTNVITQCSLFPQVQW